MKEQKMPLSEEIVKYVFPGAEPAVKATRDGFIVYDFKRLYPTTLGFFIPNVVDRSNYNAVFPKSFESYFVDLNDELAFLSRLLEIKIASTLPQLKVKCLHGVSFRDEKDKLTIFRFDKLIDPNKKTELLCRANLKELTIEDKIHILDIHPPYRAEVNDFDGENYLYWTMPIWQIFKIPSEIIAATFGYLQSLH